MRPVVFTQGDPDGVGPELLLRAAHEGLVREGDRVFADPRRCATLGASLPVPWAEPGWARLQPHLVPDAPPGLTQMQSLQRAVDTVLEVPAAALVTAPIDKAVAQSEGLSTPGHTEYLAARAGGCDVAMCMAGPVLRVVLATIHVALSEVPRQLNPASIVRATRLLAEGLRTHYGIAAPRIAVFGLNPHASEGGRFGDEEARIIAPAVQQAQRVCPQAHITGPWAADTAIFAHREGRFDGVVAMYHDQGLAPFKLLHFHDGVNLTLGLPFVRTSPDHGTAKDIAGTGRVDPRSFFAAIRLARGPGA